MPASFRAASFTAADGVDVWAIEVEPEAVATAEQRKALPQGMSEVFPHRFILVWEDASGEVRLIGRDEDIQAFRASGYPDLAWRDISVPLVSEQRRMV